MRKTLLPLKLLDDVIAWQFGGITIIKIHFLEAFRLTLIGRRKHQNEGKQLSMWIFIVTGQMAELVRRLHLVREVSRSNFLHVANDEKFAQIFRDFYQHYKYPHS